jgi:heme-degrading monooxygenase HmoA
MTKMEQPFAYGVFTVKPGKETAFIAAWEEFAKSIMVRYGTQDMSVRLLQDTDNPRQFLTSGPWESFERITQWRNSREFKDFMIKLRDICDEIHPHIAKLIIELQGKDIIKEKVQTK